MKKRLSLRLLASALLALPFLTTACQESLEEKCAKECRQYTEKNCPARLEANLIIDSLTFDAATHTLKYYYTLTGVADSVGLLSRDEVRQALIKELRNTTMMRTYKNADYNFSYIYHSERRPELVLFQETLTARDYK